MACVQRGLYRTPCDYHHFKSGDRRRGDEFGVGLCVWHHRGHPENMTHSEARKVLGPSLAEGSRPFHDEFGSDDELLEIQEEILCLSDSRCF